LNIKEYTQSHIMEEFIGVEEINEDDYLDEMDLEVIDFIKNLDNIEQKPEPSQYRISTHTSNATIKNETYPNSELMIDINYLIKYLTEKIIHDNFLTPIENPIFQGIVVHNNDCSMIIRFDDDMYRKVKYIPNTVSIRQIINKETKEYETIEYFNENNMEETKEKLKEFIENYSFKFVQKNHKHKMDEKKKDIQEAFDKKNVVTTYNIYTGETNQNQKKESKEIKIIDENELKDTKVTKTTKVDDDYMYNSCSIIIKPSKEIKAVNVRLFSDSAMTITGGLKENDGYYAAQELLNEFVKNGSIIKGIKKLDVHATTESARKKNKVIYPLPSTDFISGLKVYHNVTLINSNFVTNFRIDLEILYKLLVKNEEELFVVYNPNHHRGIQISYFWNPNNENNDKNKKICYNENDIQNGICNCVKKCSTKKNRKKTYSVFDVKNASNNKNACTKVKICVFKTGSISLIGGTSEIHTKCAYMFINHILDKYYQDIVTISIDDYLNEKKNKKNDKVIEMFESFHEKPKKEKVEKVKKEKVKKEKVIKVKEMKEKKVNVSTIVFKESNTKLPENVKFKIITIKENKKMKKYKGKI
jgi:hypothetical protein